MIITARQLRLELVNSKIPEFIVIRTMKRILPKEALANALVEFEYATEFDSEHPLMQTLLAVFYPNPEARSDFFTRASLK
jgi:hypothetical protein